MSVPSRFHRHLAVACCLVLALTTCGVRQVHAADPAPTAPPAAKPDAAAELEKSLSTPAEAPPPKKAILPEMNVLDLLHAGGKVMYPIGVMGLIAIIFVIERLIGLRRGKILPRGLNQELTELASRAADVDPREIYRVCQKYPSAAANMFRAMLLKIGRSPGEVEAAVDAVRQREGTQLFNNVRWLYLAVSVAPMLGLLGTVWGMIEIFHKTAASQIVQGNRTQDLAGGIYVALVATFGGLAVAIPSAFAAHYFESRIQGMFHRIDGLLLSFHPLVERYEGRAQVRHKAAAEDGEREPAVPPRPDNKVVKQTREAKV
ncbi:MAG: MotA/TolQ/ExbB proton channel family protein [Planctomycetes bacterium]|nr:MotA/TolQ/ExbB proton channel family protein [Planctomycetota bacterium]